MDVCYFLVDVQEITISPYFGVKQGDYFIPFLSKDPVYIKIWDGLEDILSILGPIYGRVGVQYPYYQNQAS